MNSKILSVVITKNRPHILETCINSFFRCAQSLDLPLSTVIVIDDSDSNPRLAEYDAVLSRVGVAASSVELRHVTKPKSPFRRAERHLVAFSETLGRSLWSPSRARNCALEVVRGVASHDDVVLFFDDDIVFDYGTYHGIQYRLAGRTILEESISLIARDNQTVVGCRYNGRADISLTEHLAHYARQMLAMEANGNGTNCASTLTRQLLAYPGLPLVVHGDHQLQETYQGPAGLSLGFLALSARMLPAVRFPDIYNEDWFWIEVLLRRGARCIQLSHALLHAPDLCYGFTLERALSQEVGDIIWDTLKSSGTGHAKHKRERGHLNLEEWLDQIAVMKERKVRNLRIVIDDIQEIQRLYERRFNLCDDDASTIPEALHRVRSDLTLLKESLEQTALSHLLRLVKKARQYQTCAADAPCLLKASSSEWNRARRHAEWDGIEKIVALASVAKRGC